MSTYATVCVRLSSLVSSSVTLPSSLTPASLPSRHGFSPSITFFFFFLSVWVSMWSDPGELITVGAGVAGTKTLHRQHNSGSRNQTGSTQPPQTGPAQISSVQSSRAHGCRKSSTGLRAFHNYNESYNISTCWYKAWWIGASFVGGFNKLMLSFRLQVIVMVTCIIELWTASLAQLQFCTRVQTHKRLKCNLSMKAEM